MLGFIESHGVGILSRSERFEFEEGKPVVYSTVEYRKKIGDEYKTFSVQVECRGWAAKNFDAQQGDLVRFKGEPRIKTNEKEGRTYYNLVIFGDLNTLEEEGGEEFRSW